MANTKEYSIKINGITESINAVDSLNKQLNALESRIKALESSNIKVGASSVSSSAKGSTSVLTQEVALQKELNNLKNEGARIDAKIEASQTEVYRQVQATKELYKEVIADQKQMEAQERLIANSYSNTMAGMKQHLADLKTMINTTDLGDADKIKQMTQEANELTNKLKKMEEAYGQFGRNVGNYQDAANGFKGLAIQVGDTTQKFDNAKQAYKELSNELRTLQAKKDQGILLSAEEEKRFKELPTVVAQIKSSIQDAGKPMDTLMDSMQSIVALAQARKGISAFFGLDGDEIERSIQKLVALQNAMKGLETINKQLQSGEFMGGMLSKANGMIDAFAAKIMGASKAQETLSTTAKAAEVSSKGLTAAETAQAVATTTTTVATKALSLALKSIGIGLVIAAVATLIEYWEDIVGWFEDTVPALKNLGTWFDKLKAILAGVGTALVKWVIAPFKLAADVISAILDGRFSDLPKVIGNSLKDSYNVIENYQKGHNKAVENQQKKHNQKMREEQLKANEEAEKDAEARYGKDYARTQKHYKDQLGLLNKQLSSVKKGSDEYKKIEQQRQETQRKLWESERSQREENQKKATAANKKYSKELLEAENELTRLRINNMKEGLRKTITQLEEERKAKLAKVRQNGIMVAELEAEINKEYDRKIEDEKKKHADNIKNIYKEMEKSLLDGMIDYYEKLSNIQKRNEELSRKKESNASNQLFNQAISSYGIQGKTSYKPETQESLGIISTAKHNEMVDDYKKLIDIMRQYSLTSNQLKNIELRNNNELDFARQKLFKVEEETNKKLEQLERDRAFMWDEEYEKKKYDIEKEYDIELEKYNKLEEQYAREYNLTKMSFDAKKKLYDDYNAELAQKYYTQEQQAQANDVFNTLLEEGYSESMTTMFDQRLGAVETYWKMFKYNIQNEAEEAYKIEFELLKKKNEKEKEEENEHWREYLTKQQDLYRQEKDLIETRVQTKEITEKEGETEIAELRDKYLAYQEAQKIVHDNKLLAIDKEFEQKKIELENEKNDKLKKVNTEYYQESLQEFRDFQTALSNLANKQPVMNALGIVNLKQTNKNNRELLDGYNELARQIQQKREQLTKDFQGGLIDKDAYQSSLREMDSFVADLGEKMDKVKYELSFAGQWEMLAQGINQWVQMVGQGISSIMSSLSEITQNQYEAQISEQEKYIEQYEDLLDKQKEATQKYADEVNSIEDELKTARGDRRQELIDQLNAQMAAQRASYAEEKRLEKEKQKADDKKKILEQEQAKAKKKMDLAQAYINMAMAISMAAVNKWPVPAIPMMAMAAAAAAAQIAAIKSQNIPSYGSGGLLEGKSHKEGGIKTSIGNSPIELEGQEYVIRKKSTADNIPVLDFINRSERKLNLGDFIDFYSSNKVKKSIVSANPRTKFESGGMLPLMSNDIELNDRLIDTMETYANRPIYVAVTEIEDAQANVRNVRVLSGLEE